MLKNIRYIFQIPMAWFHKVDALLRDHPGPAMRFDQSSDGSRSIGVDLEVLDKRYGGGASGTVTSVDGVGPNASGNVVLNALTESDLGDTVAKQSDLEAVQQTAEDAAASAESASTAAGEAATAAANAQTTANNASTAAGSASTAAANAQAAANDAATAAEAAGNAADAAQDAADAALAVANSKVSFPGFGGGGSASTASHSDHAHGNLTNDGKVNVNYPSGGCLAAIDENGNITAASFESQSSPYVTPENVRKLLSTCNLETSGTVTLKGAQVKLATASKVVETDANGNLTTSSKNYAELTSTAPSAVGTANAVGTATTAARADHVHAQKTYTASKWMKTDASGNVGTTDEVPISASTTATGLVFNTQGAISYKAINGASGVAGLDANSKIAFAQLPTGTTSSTVATGDHLHTGVYAPASTVSFPGFGGTGSATTASRSDHAHGNLTSGGVVNVAYVSGGCLAAIGSDGKLTAASFSGQSAPYVTADNVKKLLSTCNLETSGTVTLKGAQVKLATASKVVETDANGNLTTSSKEYAEKSSLTASSLCGTDANGKVTALLALLTSAPTSDKVLTVKSGGTALSWQDGGGGSPENPSSKTTANITSEGTATANSTSWTYAGTNGMQLTVCSRVFYDHTAATPVLYGFYRTWTFDKKGRLYSISGETRYEIDTPVVGNLTT